MPIGNSMPIVVAGLVFLFLVIGLVLGYHLRDCSEAVKEYRNKVEQVFDRKRTELENDKIIRGASQQITYALQVLDAIRNEIRGL